MGKYEPLPQFLEKKGASEIRLRFDQIEKALGFKLPKSAYKHPAWWANHGGTHSHARTWLRAGWQTKDVDLGDHKVTFQRAPKRGARRTTGRWGGMAGTITIAPGVDLTAPGDERWNAMEGRLFDE